MPKQEYLHTTHFASTEQVHTQCDGYLGLPAGRPSQQLAGNRPSHSSSHVGRMSDHTPKLTRWSQGAPRFESSAKFPAGSGHHIPAPLWEGCRATIQKLLSCLSVPAGGCRSSGWALVVLAVVLLALVLFAGLWVWGFFLVLLCEGADPRTADPRIGFLPQVSPSLFWDFWLPPSEASRVGGHLVVGVVMGQMVGDRRSPSATMLGGEFVFLLRQPSDPGHADRFHTS